MARERYESLTGAASGSGERGGRGGRGGSRGGSSRGGGGDRGGRGRGAGGRGRGRDRDSKPYDREGGKRDSRGQNGGGKLPEVVTVGGESKRSKRDRDGAAPASEPEPAAKKAKVDAEA